jgi:hypothetical protein
MRAILILALLVLPLAHADVGPSPAPPTVVVHLVKEGQPASSVAQITYHCMGTDERNETGAVSPYPVNLSCSGGTCTNDQQWYYKFNPCFSFPRGYFTYEYDGKQIRSEDWDLNKSYEKYDITIDAPTGQISGNSGSSCNLAGFVLATVAASALAYSRK